MSTNKIKCLICGKFFVRPASHVWQVHEISAYEYKKAFGLDTKRGIATEEYKEKMRERLKENPHVIELLTYNGQKSRFKKGDKALGKYERSAQTMERLREHGKKTIHKATEKIPRAERIQFGCCWCGKEIQVKTRTFEKQRNVYCSRSCSTSSKNSQKTV